jgi:hypothetical protein
VLLKLDNVICYPDNRGYEEIETASAVDLMVSTGPQEAISEMEVEGTRAIPQLVKHILSIMAVWFLGVSVYFCIASASEIFS